MTSLRPKNTQKTLVARKGGRWEIEERALIPALREGEVMIRVMAIALNPSDVKQLDLTPIEGAVCGCDLSGIVTDMSKTNISKSLRIGDHVSSFVFGCNPNRPDNGAFSEYVVVRSEFCIRLPKSIDFAEGSSFGVGLVTCGLALRSLKLINDSGEATKNNFGEMVLVYGGSTATGTLAIQLLHQLGYNPVATSSPHNFSLLREYGATAVFDYNNTACGVEIRNYTKNHLNRVLDCIGNNQSTTISYEAIGTLGGRYTSVAPFPGRLVLRRKQVHPDWILGYTVFGDDVRFDDTYKKTADPKDGIFTSIWILKMEKLLASGCIKSHPIQLREDGLRGIVRDADLLRHQKVSGHKLVYVMQDY
ncbi:GroES-like protein [Corynespora cassiicola Philippines]|uniref:GroES-like protein n=1 Tax=Corynespora cassiicola Philippines TaxID=1448308 RepID=A0A2T2NQM3_CORCC|nr:GroES-like protein [Corynespora cassiicola Philippines]